MVWLILWFLTTWLLRDLWPAGFFWSHDGQFHLVRLMHFFTELTSGQFPVRFASQMAQGYGYPTFNFYYPLTYYLGSIFKVLGFDFGFSMKLVMYLSTLVSIAGMYMLGKHKYGKWVGLLGAIVYLLVPYRLVVTYVVGSIPILLTMAVVPWLLLAIENRNLKQISIWFALLILSHNISALIVAPLVVFFALLQRNIKVWMGLLWGLGLSAFFLVPALMETSWLKMGQSLTVNFGEHFPTLGQLLYSKWGYEYSNLGTNRDGMSFQLGVLFWLVMGAVFIKSLFVKKETEVIGVWVLAAVSLLMMLQISEPLWRTIPLVSQIQFPWKIALMTSITTPLLLMWLAKHKTWIFIILLIPISVYTTRNYTRSFEPRRYSDEQIKELSYLYLGSTDIAYEARPYNSEFVPSFRQSETSTNPLLRVNYKGRVIEVVNSSDSVQEGTLNTYFYPWWKSADKNIAVSNDQGLVKVKAQPKTESKIRYSQTGLEILMNVVSIISLLALFLYKNDTLAKK